MADLSKWDHKINPFQDILDTRMILERIEEIESEYLDGVGEIGPVHTWVSSDRIEWEALQEIIFEVGEDACRNGVTLIRESYFRDHIKEEYEEIGGEYWERNPRYPGRGVHESEFRRIPLDELYSRPPFNRIDWDAVAEDVRSDYSIYEFDGITYYYDGQ